MIKDKETKQIYDAEIFLEKDISHKSFINKVKIFSQLSHPSITNFIGYSLIDFDDEPNQMIIAEYYENDDLYKILTKIIN